MTNTIIYRGAEAVLIKSHYLNKQVVEKRRVNKSYRIPEIDTALISSRTKDEAKLISAARKSGVCVPFIYDIDLIKGILTIEYIDGIRIKDMINTVSVAERKKRCIQIGGSIAKLHKADIIHGDITTSNMILKDDCLYFIDFGLGSLCDEIEAKGVDLHVLMEAFESTHSQYPKCFSYVLQGYKKGYSSQAQAVINKIDDIVKRGRYR